MFMMPCFMEPILDLCMSCLRRGHANLLYIILINPRRHLVSSLSRGHANLLYIVLINSRKHLVLSLSRGHANLLCIVLINPRRHLVSSLSRGHANLLCIVPILSDVSKETPCFMEKMAQSHHISRTCFWKCEIYMRAYIACHQNVVRFKNFLLSFMTCSQIWLNPLVDDGQYNT